MTSPDLIQRWHINASDLDLPARQTLLQFTRNDTLVALVVQNVPSVLWLFDVWTGRILIRQQSLLHFAVAIELLEDVLLVLESNAHIRVWDLRNGFAKQATVLQVLDTPRQTLHESFEDFAVMFKHPELVI
eukprot:TRINITY_DN12300_c0_g1_i2.p3 TRINITY_DN12300_c0_g1~~TRINITY_DN12300_c0_g1_i2.p3  ORF type:complete len:131 (+),score=17.74 TRINITY_DN12300_c0_g1_i2:1166-1558(+)